jgi:hypothetical protein
MPWRHDLRSTDSTPSSVPWVFVCDDIAAVAPTTEERVGITVGMHAAILPLRASQETSHRFVHEHSSASLVEKSRTSLANRFQTCSALPGAKIMMNPFSNLTYW